MSSVPENKIPDVCPKCGASVKPPEKFSGMWDGHKPDGTKVGGGIFKTKCASCAENLEAFVDVIENIFVWVVDPGLPDFLKKKSR